VFIEGDEIETEGTGDKSQIENDLGDSNPEDDLDGERDFDSDNSAVDWTGLESDVEEGI
jgi:hypothetical protein